MATVTLTISDREDGNVDLDVQGDLTVDDIVELASGDRAPTSAQMAAIIAVQAASGAAKATQVQVVPLEV